MLRQSLSRYAIRAGRNSPVKEFRSLCYLFRGHDHFCHALYVTIQVGLYLPANIFYEEVVAGLGVLVSTAPPPMAGLPRYCPRLRMFTDIARFSFYISRGNGSSKEGFHLTKATNCFTLGRL